MRIKTTILTMALFTVTIVNVKAQTIVKSPKRIAFDEVYREKDSTRVVVLGEQFLKKYPMDKANYESDRADNIDYYRIYLRLITAQKAEVDDRIKKYLDVLPYYAVADLYYHQVQLLNQFKILTAAQLLERSELLLKKIKTFQNNKPVEFVDKTEDEWNKAYDRLYFGSLLVHVNILKNTGNIKEGLIAANEAMSRYGYGISSLNDDYVQLLNESGLKEKVQKALEASVNANQATPLILDMLKKNYLARNNKESDFEAYVESLKSKEGQAELESELAKSMIKKEIPAFALYDGNGKLVSTKDWKGKVVVLDFFASWCTPCKAAFPGMKMALEKFAGDKDVLFYFIDNQEHGKDYKAGVMKYIKDNNFPFTILFDNEGDKGTNNQVAKLLNVTAIPRKMVLDKNGAVRFDMDGYYGSPTKLADEIKIMVNLAKKAI